MLSRALFASLCFLVSCSVRTVSEEIVVNEAITRKFDIPDPLDIDSGNLPLEDEDDEVYEEEPIELRDDEKLRSIVDQLDNFSDVYVPFKLDQIIRLRGFKSVKSGEEEIEEHEYDTTAIDEWEKNLRIENQARPVILRDTDETEEPRDLSSCTSFEESNKNPGSAISVVSTPWASHNRKTCKLFMKWADGSSGVCSASLIGPFHILTAAHCTLDGCGNGFAQQVMVKCGYGYYSGAQDFAILGTAFVTTCTHYTNYVNGQSCVNGESRGPFKWDIQICRLDRSLLHSHGHYGTTTANYNKLNVRGYPGDSNLNAYISQATRKQLWRFTPSKDLSSKQYRLNGAFIFGGESGCPYYAYKAATNERFVSAVHNGGPSGCYELGRRVDGHFIGIIKSKLKDWSSDKSWCNVIEDYTNFGNHAAPWKGISSGGGYSSSIQVSYGGVFSSKLPLLNVGNKATGNFVVRYYGRRNGVLTNLGSILTTVSGWSTKLIIKNGLLTSPLIAGNTYTIIARWFPACKAGSDPQETSLGSLYVKKLNFNQVCTKSSDCISGNCHNGRCCAFSEKTPFCNACSTSQGSCISCLPYHVFPDCTKCTPNAYKDPSTNKCLPKKPNGQTCTSGQQCLSGFCRKLSIASVLGSCAELGLAG